MSENGYFSVRALHMIRPMHRPIPPASIGLLTAASPIDHDACYLALKARDPRFDGQFFVAVSSTGIYCRPVCRVRTPKAENCRFFPLAAQAESAGFRPCLRCRPELAPSGTGAAVWSMQDASAILARHAAALLDDPSVWGDAAPSMLAVANRLGVSERHMRRIFESEWGVSPWRYLQTRRLLMAKRLLTDTQLPIAQVAHSSGFGSLRRFNACIAAHYRMQPRQLRQPDKRSNTAWDGAIVLKAAYRPPYDVAGMLGFFAKRQISGVEAVDMERKTLSRSLAITAGDASYNGWVQAQFVPAHCSVLLRISPTLGTVLPQVLLRLRALLDLDADPHAIHTVLQSDFPDAAGLRVPGCVDGFELGVRAILGQQITVQAARTLGQRLVERFGSVLQDASVPSELGLTRLFPTAELLNQIDTETLGTALGELGIVRQRQRAIAALAQAVAQGGLQLQPGMVIATTITTLQALPGIGPWTANYIAMRALRWPDAFVAGDVALQKALGVPTANPKQAAQIAEAASQRWKPWRSYAVVRAWHSL